MISEVRKTADPTLETTTTDRVLEIIIINYFYIYLPGAGGGGGSRFDFDIFKVFIFCWKMGPIHLQPKTYLTERNKS